MNDDDEFLSHTTIRRIAAWGGCKSSDECSSPPPRDFQLGSEEFPSFSTRLRYGSPRHSESLRRHSPIRSVSPRDAAYRSAMADLLLSPSESRGIPLYSRSAGREVPPAPLVPSPSRSLDSLPRVRSDTSHVTSPSTTGGSPRGESLGRERSHVAIDFGLATSSAAGDAVVKECGAVVIEQQLARRDRERLEALLQQPRRFGLSPSWSRTDRGAMTQSVASPQTEMARAASSSPRRSSERAVAGTERSLLGLSPIGGASFHESPGRFLSTTPIHDRQDKSQVSLGSIHGNRAAPSVSIDPLRVAAVEDGNGKAYVSANSFPADTGTRDDGDEDAYVSSETPALVHQEVLRRRSGEHHALSIPRNHDTSNNPTESMTGRSLTGTTLDYSHTCRPFLSAQDKLDAIKALYADPICDVDGVSPSKTAQQRHYLRRWLRTPPLPTSVLKQQPQLQQQQQRALITASGAASGTVSTSLQGPATLERRPCLQWDEQRSGNVLLSEDGLVCLADAEAALELITTEYGADLSQHARPQMSIPMYALGTVGAAEGTFIFKVRVSVEQVQAANDTHGAPLFAVGMTTQHFRGPQRNAPAYLFTSNGKITASAATFMDAVDYGEPYGPGDEVTVRLMLMKGKASTLSFDLNDTHMGTAFRFIAPEAKEPLFPLVVLREEGCIAELLPPF